MVPGSCVDAGYSDCCAGGFCAGNPPNCFCDNTCGTFGDCCDDFDSICTVCKYNIALYTYCNLMLTVFVATPQRLDHAKQQASLIAALDSFVLETLGPASVTPFV